MILSNMLALSEKKTVKYTRVFLDKIMNCTELYEMALNSLSSVYQNVRTEAIVFIRNLVENINKLYTSNKLVD